MVLLPTSATLRTSGSLHCCGNGQRRLLALSSEVVNELQWKWTDISISARPPYRATMEPSNWNRLLSTRFNLAQTHPLFFVDHNRLFSYVGSPGGWCQIHKVIIRNYSTRWSPRSYGPVTLIFIYKNVHEDHWVSLTLGQCKNHRIEGSPQQPLSHTPYPDHYCAFSSKPGSPPDSGFSTSHSCEDDHISQWPNYARVHDLWGEEYVVNLHISFIPRLARSGGQCLELRVR